MIGLFCILATMLCAVNAILFFLAYFWWAIGLDVLVAIWVTKSWANIVRSDEVALRRFFGDLEEEIRRSGLVFVPWFWGIDLVRIPTRMFRLKYEGREEHRLWSRDNQLLMAEISVYLKFPYRETKSLVTLIESGVPLAERGLASWIEEEVITVAREVMARFDYKEAISKESLDAINNEAVALFCRPNGLLCKSGVVCRSSDQGDVFLRIEQVRLTSNLQRKLELVEAAKLEASAAKSIAERNAEETAGRILLMVAKTSGLTIDQLVADLQANPRIRGLPAAEGGYKEAFAFAEDQIKRDRAGESGELTDIRVGNTDGTSFKDAGLGSLIGGLAAAARQFGKGSGNPGNPGGNPGGGRGDKKIRYSAKEIERLSKIMSSDDLAKLLRR